MAQTWKKSLYESIMKNVAKQVKKALNERNNPYTEEVSVFEIADDDEDFDGEKIIVHDAGDGGHELAGEIKDFLRRRHDILVDEIYHIGFDDASNYDDVDCFELDYLGGGRVRDHVYDDDK